MKRSITTFLIVAVAALLVVFYFLGMDLLRQQQQHQVLADEIAKATQTLAKTPKPSPDVGQRLAAAQAEQMAAQSTLPEDLNSTQVINAILKEADVFKVKAIPLSTRPWAKESFGEGYYVFRVNMTVVGTFSHLSDFVNQLENGGFPTLVIESLDVNRIAVPPEETESVTAHLGVAVYSRFTTAE